MIILGICTANLLICHALQYSFEITKINKKICVQTCFHSISHPEFRQSYGIPNFKIDFCKRWKTTTTTRRRRRRW